MTRNAPARFHWRAFVTLYVTLSFVLLAASGTALYVAPPGRVANWSRSTLGGLDRHGGQAVHTVFALLLALERLAATTPMPLDRVLANLDGAGVKGAQPGTTVAALASANGLTPQEVWVRLKGRERPKEIPAGGGYGGKTVGEVCTQLGVPVEEGLSRLRAKGIEASEATPMKDMAGRHGSRPHDLVEILAGA